MANYEYANAYESTGLYANPGVPYVLTTTINSTFQGVQVYSAVGANFESSLKFPSVTTFIVLTNGAATGSGENMTVGFSRNGLAGENYFTLTPQQSLSLNIRAPEVFFSGSADTQYELIAGMSNAPVPNRRSFNLSGSLGIG